MSNNEETGPSDQDADEMDYEGEQDYLDFLTAKQRQGLQSASMMVLALASTPTAPAPMAAPRPVGKVPPGKIPAPMPVPKRGIGSRGYENLTN